MASRLSLIKEEGFWEAAIVIDGAVEADLFRGAYHEVAPWAIAKGITVEQLPQMMQRYADPGCYEREMAWNQRDESVTYVCGSCGRDNRFDFQPGVSPGNTGRVGVWCCHCGEHTADAGRDRRKFFVGAEFRGVSLPPQPGGRSRLADRYKAYSEAEAYFKEMGW